MAEAPRVWSRDDIMEAARLCRIVDYRSTGESNRQLALNQAQRMCEILAFAERNATLHVDQGRDERGRFLPKPQLHTEAA